MPVHATAQLPQCFGSVANVVSQPFVAFPSQSPKPGLQVNPHAVPLQVAVAFGGAPQGVHAVPHVAGSVFEAQPLPHACVPALHV